MKDFLEIYSEIKNEEEEVVRERFNTPKNNVLKVVKQFIKEEFMEEENEVKEKKVKKPKVKKEAKAEVVANQQ